MRSLWLYIERIKITDRIFFVLDRTAPLSSDADNNMLMGMHFKTAVSPGCYFKISQVKLSGLAMGAYQCFPDNVSPVLA